MRRRSLWLPALAVALAAVLSGPAPAPAPATADPEVSADVESAEEPTKEAAIAHADRAIAAYPEAVRHAPGDTFTALRAEIDPDGTTHVHYERLHKGLRVLGGDVIVHNAPDGTFEGANLGLGIPIAVDLTPSVAPGTAASTSLSRFSGAIEAAAKPELVLDATSGTAVLAWETVVSGTRADSPIPSRLHVLVDATTGEPRGTFDEVRSADGKGVGAHSGPVSIETTKLPGDNWFTLHDSTRGGSRTCDMLYTTHLCEPMTSMDNTKWGDGTANDPNTTGVDAHYGMAMAWDYFKFTHGREGVSGVGASLTARVHLVEPGVPPNAYWTGSEMWFGVSADKKTSLATLEVVGHEFTHGVVMTSAMLGFGEADAIDESTSDIFGSMIKFYAKNPLNPPDYKIATKTKVFERTMFNPAANGDHSCWFPTIGEHVFESPHAVGGVSNHFFFMLAEGSGATPYGYSPVCDEAAKVPGIGPDKAAAIWYRALTRYFTSNTGYTGDNNVRKTSLKATEDLYGLCSVEYKSVQLAWNAVNVPSAGDTPCQSPYPTKCPAPATNGDNLAIPDGTNTGPGPSVTSTVQVADCPGNGTPGIKVDVTIAHTFRGDLGIRLLGPDGFTTELKAPDPDDGLPDLLTFYVADASQVSANGTWTLQITDHARLDTGTLDKWAVTI